MTPLSVDAAAQELSVMSLAAVRPSSADTVCLSRQKTMPSSETGS